MTFLKAFLAALTLVSQLFTPTFSYTAASAAGRIGYPDFCEHRGTVSSPKGLCVVGADPLDIEVGDGRAWERAHVYPVSAPETAWISALKNRHPHARLHPVSETHEEWDHQVSSLTPAAAAIVALAVTLATQGAGASLIAPLIGALELGGTMAATVTSPGLYAMKTAETGGYWQDTMFGKRGASVRALNTRVLNHPVTKYNPGWAGMATTHAPQKAGLTWEQQWQKNFNWSTGFPTGK